MRLWQLRKELIFCLAATAFLVSMILAQELRAQDDIVCDVPYVGTIANPLEIDVLHFSVIEGEVCSFVVNGYSPPFEPVWRILKANGTPWTDWTDADQSDQGPFPASGSPYRIEIMDSGHNATGTYTIHMQRLTASAACESTPLPCDVPLTGTIGSTTDTDLLAFSADGEMCSFVVEGYSPPFEFLWRVVAADGTPWTGWTNADQSDQGPFPASGSPYRIEIMDSGHNATGTYTIHMQRLTASAACESTPLPCDVPLTGTIGSTTDTDLLAFSVTQGAFPEGEMCSFVVEGYSPPFEFLWRVVAADGTPWTGWTDADQSDQGPFPASGSPYRIEIMDSGHNATGTYTIHMQRLTASAACESTPLTCGVPFEGVIEHRTDTDLLIFAVKDGEVCTVLIVPGSPPSPNFLPLWRVVRRDGIPLSGWTDADQADIGPFPFAGTGNPYRIEIMDSGHDATGTYDVSVAGCEPTGIDVDTPAPGQFALYQNVPNPFNPTTLIGYDVPPGGSQVTLRVFDVSGSVVRTLVDRVESPGQKTIQWDGTTEHGHQVSTGVYFYRLSAGSFVETKKMVLLK